MSEYIDREAAYEVLTEYYHHSTEFQHLALKDALARVPAADVVERSAVCPHYICNVHDRGDDSLCGKYHCEVKAVERKTGRLGNNWIPPKNKYPYTFECEFLLPEPWDNEKNRERFEDAILKAFIEAFPNGVDIINRTLYFTGARMEYENGEH